MLRFSTVSGFMSETWAMADWVVTFLVLFGIINYFQKIRFVLEIWLHCLGSGCSAHNGCGLITMVFTPSTSESIFPILCLNFWGKMFTDTIPLYLVRILHPFLPLWHSFGAVLDLASVLTAMHLRLFAVVLYRTGWTLVTHVVIFTCLCVQNSVTSTSWITPGIFRVGRGMSWP